MKQNLLQRAFERELTSKKIKADKALQGANIESTENLAGISRDQAQKNADRAHELALESKKAADAERIAAAKYRANESKKNQTRWEMSEVTKRKAHRDEMKFKFTNLHRQDDQARREYALEIQKFEEESYQFEQSLLHRDSQFYDGMDEQSRQFYAGLKQKGEQFEEVQKLNQESLDFKKQQYKEGEEGRGYETDILGQKVQAGEKELSQMDSNLNVNNAISGFRLPQNYIGFSDVNKRDYTINPIQMALNYLGDNSIAYSTRQDISPLTKKYMASGSLIKSYLDRNAPNLTSPERKNAETKLGLEVQNQFGDIINNLLYQTGERLGQHDKRKLGDKLRKFQEFQFLWGDQPFAGSSQQLMQQPPPQ